MKYIVWLLLFIPALLVEFICYLTNPIACILIESRRRTDIVKRQGKQVVTMKRDYLIPFFYLWQTHDNAVDEGWYGAYEIQFLANKTQADYDNSALIRYWCRLWWLSRNTAYGWHYLLFSAPVEPLIKEIVLGREYYTPWLRLRLFKSSFQVEAHLPVLPGKYMSLNFGWKEHKDMPKKLYANRVLGAIRRYRKPQ